MKKGIKTLFLMLSVTTSLFGADQVIAFGDDSDNSNRQEIQSYSKRKRIESTESKVKKECELYINQNDEEAIYDGHGFTRGDLAHLYEFKFDPNTVINIDGKVLKVFRVKYPNGECYVLGILSTTSGEALVNFAPISYLDDHKVKISEGDTVQITGSQTRINGRNFFVASKLIKDGKTTDLKGQWFSDSEETEE